MLSNSESWPVFKYILLCCKLSLIPYEIDTESGKLRQCSRIKRFLWVSVYSYSALYTLNTVFCVMRLLTIDKALIVLHHLPIQLNMCIVPCLILPATFVIHWHRSETLIMTFNELYAPSVNSCGKRSRKLFNYSRDEFLAVYLPFPFTSVPLCFGIMMLLEPTMSHLVINSVLGGTYNDIMFVMVTIAEMYATSVWVLNAGFFLVFDCLVFSHLETIHEKILPSNERGLRMDTYKVNKTCREMQLLISMFNMANALHLHAIKMVCMLAAIHHGYFAIRYFSRNPFVGLYNCWVHINCHVSYGLTFKEAYRIRLRMENIRKQASAVAKSNGRSNVMTRSLKSISTVGIKVGQFHEMERNSTIVFVDFVITQMVGLLVSL